LDGVERDVARIKVLERVVAAFLVHARC
jgi:hypothetical protein